MKGFSSIPTAYFVGLLVFMTLAGASGSTSAQLPTIRFVRDPDPAPEFKLKTLDGKEISLADSRGKVILLNFWATWCGPCRAEIPSLIQLQKRYSDNLQIIGLDVDDDEEDDVRKVVTAQGINYPVAVASPQVRMAYGGITALPTVFVINSEGRAVQKHVGLFNPALYETEVRALLQLPVAARVQTFEDTGEIFLKHADRATDLPGVKLAGLSQDQRAAALKKLNAENCTCGCKFTLAQCRIYDPACQISTNRAAEIVKEVSNAEKKPLAPADTAKISPPPAAGEGSESASPSAPPAKPEPSEPPKP